MLCTVQRVHIYCSVLTISSKIHNDGAIILLSFSSATSSLAPLVELVLLYQLHLAVATAVFAAVADAAIVVALGVRLRQYCLPYWKENVSRIFS